MFMGRVFGEGWRLINANRCPSYSLLAARHRWQGWDSWMAFQFTVNGAAVSVDAPAVTPLLWVIREELKLTGTKFGTDKKT
jgi:hypothetical protein